MARATGIGGVFFRSADPAATVAWYRQHLGIEPDEHFPGAVIPSIAGEYTVWGVFESDTDYFGPMTQSHMINYRVDDLDGLLAQLRAAGVEVDEQTQDTEQGRFGWAVDLDGRRFELWQPPVGEE